MQIKKVFRVAVHVQRTQFVQLAIIVVHARRAVAISCGGRCIDKTRFLTERPGGEVPGELVIVADEKTGVGLGRGGAGAQVQHEVKFAPGAALQPWEQIVGLDVIGKAQRREIAPPFVRAEAVADDDAFAAAAVQRPDQRAADKARAAGDEHPRIGKIIGFHEFRTAWRGPGENSSPWCRAKLNHKGRIGTRMVLAGGGLMFDNILTHINTKH